MAALLVVVFAGCGGPLPSTNASPTATPVPVPADLPPGVTDDGVADPSALVGAHEAVLADTTHRITATEVRRNPDGSIVGRFDAERRVDPDQARSHTSYDLTGDIAGLGRLPNSTRLETYRDGDTIYGVEANATTTQYVQTTTDARGIGDPLADPLVTVFAATAVRVDGPEPRNGTTLYRLDAVDITRRTLLSEGLANRPSETVENVTLAAAVDERGLIHEYRLAYTLHDEGTTIRVRRTVRYETGDWVTVTEPPWVPVATATADSS